METSSPLTNKYFFPAVLFFNGAGAYHKMNFFAPNSMFVKVYLFVFAALLLSSLIAGNEAWFWYVKWVVLGVHALFHGMFLLSLPMGLVFALTGSYLLALQVFVVFYLPSAIALFLDIYMFRRMRIKN